MRASRKSDRRGAGVQSDHILAFDAFVRGELGGERGPRDAGANRPSEPHNKQRVQLDVGEAQEKARGPKRAGGAVRTDMRPAAMGEEAFGWCSGDGADLHPLEGTAM